MKAERGGSCHHSPGKDRRVVVFTVLGLAMYAVEPDRARNSGWQVFYTQSCKSHIAFQMVRTYKKIEIPVIFTLKFYNTFNFVCLRQGLT